MLCITGVTLPLLSQSIIFFNLALSYLVLQKPLSKAQVGAYPRVQLNGAHCAELRQMASQACMPWRISLTHDVTLRNPAVSIAYLVQLQQSSTWRHGYLCSADIWGVCGGCWRGIGCFPRS